MWIDRQDLLYTIRSARRVPLLTAVAILALSLGIGLNAGVFTLLNVLFLNSPVLHDPSSFVQLYPRYEGWFTGAGQYSTFSTEDYEAIHAQSNALADSAAWQPSSAVLQQARQSIGTVLVTCNYFHVFGADHPQMGRFFTPQECARGSAAQVAVLSGPSWKTLFGADPRIVGKTIHLNGLPFQVIGVVSADDANIFAGAVFIPYTLQPLLDRSYSHWANPDSPWLSIAGRLRKGYSRAKAQSEVGTILRRQDAAYLNRKLTPFNRKTSIVLTNGSFIANPSFERLVSILMVLILGPLSLILLLACCNVTMLFLSRAIIRRGEIAVRLALGVSRGRLARMLLLESLLTTGIAGALSIVLAYRVPQMIVNVVDPEGTGMIPLLHPNWRVFAYLAALVAIAAVISSLAPMHASWKLDLRSRTTAGLIVMQIAMSFVLMAAAVLFWRIPGRITGMDPGFETHQTLLVPLDINASPGSRAAALNFYQSLESHLRAIPTVQSLSYASLQPFRQSAPEEILLPGQHKGQGKPVSLDLVSKDFFSTFGIRFIAGRAFSASDLAGTSATSVAVVSQAFAKEFWPGGNPLGKQVVTSDGRQLIVVGVAADIRSEQFGTLDGSRLYALRDPGSLDGKLFIRFTGSASNAENAVRDAVKAVDPTQIELPRTIWEGLEENAEAVRSLARIILVMASIAVLLAITGVYGVLSFAVNQRTREFGIRMVLGANRLSIFRSIMLRGAQQTGIGVLGGIVLAVPAAQIFSRLVQHSPVPVPGLDPTVYVIAGFLLLIVALAAMYLPAVRATRVDPIKALRTE